MFFSNFFDKNGKFGGRRGFSQYWIFELNHIDKLLDIDF